MPKDRIKEARHYGRSTILTNVGIEVGLASLDGSLDALQAVATLSHVPLQK